MSKETVRTYGAWNSLMEEFKKDSPWLKDDIEFNEKWIDMLGLIIEKRKELGLSQRDIAEMIDKPQSTIARIEASKTIPNLQTLFKITNALGMSIIIK
ncbi:MAG: helix-turn-helix transcriptional regulator [Erysipelotrichaceae bacterium]|nr:helix-turn-helix transcriptional regulator [Erysipelotrichaceae bacterium]